MDLNDGKFQQNGVSGFILKPEIMRDGKGGREREREREGGGGREKGMGEVMKRGKGRRVWVR